MLNRRRFLELLGLTTAAGAVVYSFPTVIVPNITLPREAYVNPTSDDWLVFYEQQLRAVEEWSAYVPIFEAPQTSRKPLFYFKKIGEGTSV